MTAVILVVNTSSQKAMMKNMKKKKINMNKLKIIMDNLVPNSINSISQHKQQRTKRTIRMNKE